MNDDTPTSQTPNVRLFWLDPTSHNAEDNLRLVNKLADVLNEAINDGWEVVARTPLGSGILYEVRRVNGGAE